MCDGLDFGFDTLVSTTNLPTKEYKNLLSARTQPDIVSKLLTEECDKGYALGPLNQVPFDTYRVSPIGVATGKYSDHIENINVCGKYFWRTGMEYFYFMRENPRHHVSLRFTRMLHQPSGLPWFLDLAGCFHLGRLICLVNLMMSCEVR